MAICPKGATVKEPAKCVACERPILAYTRIECSTCSTYRSRYGRSRVHSAKFQKVSA
jgi:hypothetical protein